MSRANNQVNRSKAKFPVRLHDMLTHVEAQGLGSVIEWVLGGRGFMIHNPKKLVDLLSLFFGLTKYKSFLRQLNMWDFERVPQGPNKGTYMHPYFVRGNRELCGLMSRSIKQRERPRARASSGRKSKKCSSDSCSSAEEGSSESLDADAWKSYYLKDAISELSPSVDVLKKPTNQAAHLIHKGGDFHASCSPLFTNSERDIPRCHHETIAGMASISEGLAALHEILGDYAHCYDEGEQTDDKWSQKTSAQRSETTLASCCFAGKNFFLV